VSWVLPRDQQHGWHHLQVPLSLVYRLLRCLSGLLAALVRSDLSKDAELLVLRHENQVLRRQLTGWRGRIRPGGIGESKVSWRGPGM
jgi:putative transposase